MGVQRQWVKIMPSGQQRFQPSDRPEAIPVGQSGVPKGLSPPVLDWRSPNAAPFFVRQRLSPVTILVVATHGVTLNHPVHQNLQISVLSSEPVFAPLLPSFCPLGRSSSSTVEFPQNDEGPYQTPAESPEIRHAQVLPPPPSCSPSQRIQRPGLPLQKPH